MKTIHVIEGIVIHGKKLGRTIGFPTANVPYDKNLIEDGTYKMNVIIENGPIIHSGVGTFLRKKKMIEVHIFQFKKDIYGKKIEIYFLKRIRENKSFTDIHALQSQLQKDKQTAKQIQQKVLTFGTFDYFHEGHISYLQQAKRYGDTLITIIALDETVYKIKGFNPDHNQDTRRQTVKKISITDICVLGDSVNVYSCFNIYTPDVVYLGYDQYSFDSGIISYCAKENIPIPVIIRGKSFKPNRYKSSIIKKQIGKRGNDHEDKT